MNFAILAAGDGSRLAAGGIDVPKPMVRLNGVALIDRLTDILVRNGAESISVIVNERNRQTVSFLQNKPFPVPLHLVVKSTAGSMHSLYELRGFLKDGDFCLMTVDTVFRESEFAAYLQTFRDADEIDGLMAVTDFIDDEKPLYVETDEGMYITDFCDTRQSGSRYVSGGIYCLRPAALQVLDDTMANGMTRMRDFQRQLIRHHLKLKAFAFSKIVDIDHPHDIETAENLI
ncbi:MAG: NDP-sugar synthase [Bacteroidales bacterium]|jgi:NDP-sugar pyrophosphorylase family protein|nr:NDP-sugar synthase [Bacteroidales bacterium]